MSADRKLSFKSCLQEFGLFHQAMDPESKESVQIERPLCITTAIYEWIIAEYEHISDIYGIIHGATVLHRNNIDTALAALQNHRTHVSSVSIQDLAGILGIVCPEFIALLRHHSNIDKSAAVTDGHYKSYNHYIHNVHAKKQSQYPKMLSYLVLNIHQLKQAKDLPRQIIALIETHLPDDILHMKKDGTSYGQQSLWEYIARKTQIDGTRNIIQARAARLSV